jgi:hypothetical protein
MYCTFSIGMNDGEFQYTGSGITGFDGGFIIMGETEIGYWTYTFEQMSETGAELDPDGFPLRTGEYEVTGYYTNGRYMDYKKSTLIVVPAPLTVDVLLESDSKVYDGNTAIGLGSAKPVGIIGDDEVFFSANGTPSFVSPNAGNNIEVVFTDFEIGGMHAPNYYIIQPDSLAANITRAAYMGSISVDINDDPLRIGSELTFTASANPSDYLIQWRVDGEDIEGAHDITYVVRPADVDKKITVVLVSPCRNYEGESPPTDYVPYTITLVLGNHVPMGTDDVYFGNSGIVTAYASSKNDGFVDISYILYNSGLDSDYLTFSLSSIYDVISAEAGLARYNVMPPDAVNGVIKITTTFYHRGILITPADGHIFDDLDCGYNFDDYHTLTIKQLGNAPTGQIDLSLSGKDSDAFYFSTYSIPNIDINDSVTIDVGVRTGIVPTGFYDNTFTASIDVSGEHLNMHASPVSAKIAHTYSQLIYRNGFHDHNCTGCNLYKSGLCLYGSWSVLAGVHRRSCSVCLGVESHAPVWNLWSPLNDANHLRTCTLCNITESAPHNENTIGVWGHGDTVNHVRTRHCSVCNSFMRNEALPHSWGGWSSWSDGGDFVHNRTRVCNDCNRPDSDSAPHSWGNWGAWTHGDVTNHHRTGSCTACGRAAAVGTTAGTFEAHSWGGWANHDAAHHRRTCSLCSRNDDQDHNWSTTSYTPLNINGHRRHRECIDCNATTHNDGWHYNVIWTYLPLSDDGSIQRHQFHCPPCNFTRAGGACIFNNAGVCVGHGESSDGGLTWSRLFVYGGCGATRIPGRDNPSAGW